jgi:hypothetical protein
MAVRSGGQGDDPLRLRASGLGREAGADEAVGQLLGRQLQVTDGDGRRRVAAEKVVVEEPAVDGERFGVVLHRRLQHARPGERRLRGEARVHDGVGGGCALGRRRGELGDGLRRGAGAGRHARGGREAPREECATDSADELAPLAAERGADLAPVAREERRRDAFDAAADAARGGPEERRPGRGAHVRAGLGRRRACEHRLHQGGERALVLGRLVADGGADPAAEPVPEVDEARDEFQRPARTLEGEVVVGGRRVGGVGARGGR